MSRDYYTILGVKRTAEPEQIHDAYRRLARANHPDTSGADTAGYFRDIQLAWETLGDPERRRAYDQEMAHANRAVRAVSPSQHRGTSPGRSSAQDPIHAEIGAVLSLDLRLRPFEAARGGSFPLELPALEPCHWCGGRSRLSCFACQGHGFRVYPRWFSVHVSGGVRPGELLKLSLAGLGLVHSGLLIRILIMD